MAKIIHEENVAPLFMRENDTLRITFRDENGDIRYEHEHAPGYELEVNKMVFFEDEEFLGIKKGLGCFFGEGS